MRNATGNIYPNFVKESVKRELLRDALIASKIRLKDASLDFTALPSQRNKENLEGCIAAVSYFNGLLEEEVRSDKD